MIMIYGTDREELDAIKEVEFWYDTQESRPTILSLDELVEGFSKAGYVLKRDIE